MLEALSDELLLRICAACDPSSLRTLSCASRRFHRLSHDDLLWETVFLKSLGAAPTHRLNRKSWRMELETRRHLVKSQWIGDQRKLSCCASVSRDIGEIVHVHADSAKIVLIGRDGLFVHRFVMDAPFAATAPAAINISTKIHLYSTMFSEHAIVSAATMSARYVVLGFSDGSIVACNRLPDIGWSDVRWHKVAHPGGCPPIIQLSLKQSYLLAVGQRAQSESAAFVQVFDLARNKGRLSSRVVPDFAYCELDKDGQVFVSNARMRLGDCLVADDAVTKNGDSFRLCKYSNIYHNEHSLVFQIADNELLLFSPESFQITARIKTPRVLGKILDVYVLDEVLVVAGESVTDGQGGGCMYILDAVGGQPLAKRNLRLRPDIKILYAKAGVVYFMNGRKLTELRVIPSPGENGGADGDKKKPPKRDQHLQKTITHSIQEGEEEVRDERRMDDHLERQRERMNIEGLTEEELVQYAQLLSLERGSHHANDR